MPRKAGDQRHRVALQAITGRTASGDGYVDTWTTYATVWASVVPATAAAVERLVGETQQVPITHLVDLDYREDLSAKHRILMDSRKLYIRGIQNQDERNWKYTLSCEERAQ
jgi:SPP1 family predicted phage head-tail adaptor